MALERSAGHSKLLEMVGHEGDGGVSGHFGGVSRKCPVVGGIDLVAIMHTGSYPPFFRPPHPNIYSAAACYSLKGDRTELSSYIIY